TEFFVNCGRNSAARILPARTRFWTRESDTGCALAPIMVASKAERQRHLFRFEIIKAFHPAMQGARPGELHWARPLCTAIIPSIGGAMMLWLDHNLQTHRGEVTYGLLSELCEVSSSARRSTPDRSKRVLMRQGGPVGVAALDLCAS